MSSVNRLSVLAGIGLTFASATAWSQVAHQVVADLSTIGASQPMGGLVRGPDGALYGTTWSDDGQGCGTIYRFEEPSTLRLVHRFELPGGCNPIGDLALAPNGALYGVTYSGGAHGAGTVFRLVIGQSPDTIHSFDPAVAAPPYAGLTLGADGRLYGGTAGSFTSPVAKVYAIALDGAFESVASGFFNVQAALVADTTGTLYGVDGAGFSSVGSVFRISETGQVDTVVTFPYVPLSMPLVAPYGAAPIGELALGVNGAIYGTTSSGGPNSGSGTVFRLCNPNVPSAPCFTTGGGNWTIELLHEFPPPDNGLYPTGGHPWAGVILAADGHLYGTTTAGGASANGTMFRVTSAGTFELLHSFGGLTGGVSQEARLFETSPGVFYALTSGHIHRLALTTSRPPVVEAVSTKTDEDVPVAGMLAATDPDGDPLTFSLASNGSLGTATIVDVATGAFSYVPNRDANGIDTFTFRASDGTFESDLATVTVIVWPVNDAPVAPGLTVAGDEDTPATFMLPGSDVDSPALTYAIAANGSRGTAVVTNPATGAVTYTPTPNASGVDTFMYQVSDGSLTSSAGVVTMNVASANDAPFAHATSVLALKNTPVPITVTGADSESTSLSFALITAPSHGSLSGLLPSVTYTPAPGYLGPDSFTFVASDGGASSLGATVSISVVERLWKALGPEGGTARAFASDPRDPNVTYAGIDTVGLVRTTDGGATWQPIGDGFNGRAATGVAIGSDPTQLLAVSDNQLRRSVDGGGTWEERQLPNITAIARQPLVPGMFFAMGEFELLKSVDHGLTWTSVMPFAPWSDSLRALVVDPVAPATVYVGTDQGGVFRSQDGGATWSNIESSPGVTSLAIGRSNPSVMVAATALGLRRSLDGGTTWTTLATGTVVGSPWAAVAIDPDDATVFHAGTWSSGSGTEGVYRSADAGASWARVASLPAAASVNVLYHAAGSGIVLAGVDRLGVLRSADDGQTWTQGATGTGVPAHDVAAGGDAVYASDDFGVVSSQLRGSAWERGNLSQSSGGNAELVVHPADPLTAYARRGGQLSKTHDGGATWSQGGTLPGLGEYPLIVDPQLPLTLYGVATPPNLPVGHLFKSVDDGSNWLAVFQTTYVREVAVGPTAVYVTTSDHRVLRSIDDGATWQVVGSAVPTGLRSLTIDPRQPGTLYGWTPNNGFSLYRSPDGGATWTEIASLYVRDLLVDPLDSLHLFASGSGVVESRDGGVSWTGAAPGLPDNVGVTRLAMTPGGPLFAATSDGVYRLDTSNRPPVASDGRVNASEDAPLPIVLTASDPDGQPLTFAVTTPPSHGTLSGTAPDLVYSPAEDYSGPDSFTFRVNDGIADSNDATVTIVVTAVNDAPVASPGSLSTLEDTPASGQLQASDIDSSSLTFAIATAPSLGSVALDAATGAFIYTPNPDANGADIFSFQVSDGTATSSTAQIAITIASVTDATETSVSSSPNPSVFGGLVTLRAAVTAAGGVPSGAVQFRRGAVNLGAAVTGGDGVAVMTTMRLAVGDGAITATYLGNTDYAPSTSVASPHVVVPGLRLVPQAPNNTGPSPWALAVGDFDLDGRPDVVTTNTATAGVNVLRGYGAGGFAGADSYHSGAVPIAVTTSDLTGDGRLDIVVANQGSRTVSVLRGTSTGNFDPPVSTSVSAVPRSVAIADLNRDGNDDVVVAHSVTAAAFVGVLLGNGDGTLQAPVDYPAGNGAVAIGDVDGDGELDIVNTAFAGDTVQVLRGLGDGTFVPGGSWSVPRTPWAVLVGDVNADAINDVVVLSESTTGSHDLVNVFLGQGGGALAAAVAYPVGSATSLAALDFDQDGVTDIAVAGRNTNTVSLLRGVGDGAFESAVAYSGGVGPTGLGVADFNGDGAPDVVASNNDGNSVSVFLNSGGVTVALAARPPSSPAGRPIELTATVAPTVVGAPPGGVVSFFDGDALLGTAPVDGGRAVLTTSSLTPGAHSIIARYGGDATFNPRTSAPRVVDVAAAPVTVAVESPNGGERVFANVPTTVRWTASGNPTSFDVELSRNGGTTFAPTPGCSGLAGTASSCVWTPVAPAGTTLRVRVTARNGSGAVSDVSDADFTLSTATPTVTVTAPNTAVSWRIGTVQNLRWNHNLGLGSLVRVELSRDAGASWETLAASFANTAATSSLLPWTVTGPATTSALLRVTWLGGPGVSDGSNTPFAVARPSITVTAPNTAVTWSVGSRRDITWSHNLPAGDTVDLDVSRDGGATWVSIATGVANTSATTGRYSWVVTAPETTTGRVRVRWSADAVAADSSNADFAIVAPVLTVTAPNTSVSWRVDGSQTLRATHNLGAGQQVAFDLSVDDGATWAELSQVTTGASAAVTYQWLVALPTSNLARIRARWVLTPAVTDVSDVAFRILPRITVTAPNTAVTWGAGSTRTVSWTHNLGTTEPVDIAFSADGGTSWTTVASAVANATATTGTTSVVLPDTPTSTGLVRVSQTSNPAHFDVADVFLTLVPPVITVNSPNTNVNWTIGSARNIAWSHNVGGLERVTIELSRDGGATWTPLAAAVLNSGSASGSWSWNPVSGPATLAARIRVTWDRNGTVQDVGNVNFRIQ